MMQSEQGPAAEENSQDLKELWLLDTGSNCRELSVSENQGQVVKEAAYTAGSFCHLCVCKIPSSALSGGYECAGIYRTVPNREGLL